MSSPQTNFVKVADLKDVPEGTPKAVKVEGRSVALFQHQGSFYTTDNQCPHMGYPLTRGRVRNGVLTCDWHGWSYDMRGGGCFTGGCDDLDTFPVEVRDGAIFIDVRSGGTKRKDAHLLLMLEVPHHLAGSGVAVARLPVEGAIENLFKLGGNLRV